MVEEEAKSQAQPHRAEEEDKDAASAAALLPLAFDDEHEEGVQAAGRPHGGGSAWCLPGRFPRPYFGPTFGYMRKVASLVIFGGPGCPTLYQIRAYLPVLQNQHILCHFSFQARPGDFFRACARAPPASPPAGVKSLDLKHSAAQALLDLKVERLEAGHRHTLVQLTTRGNHSPIHDAMRRP